MHVTRRRDEEVRPAWTGQPTGPGDPGDWTPPSWDEIVREHSARVYRLAYRLTGNRHDAEDLTQEVFVRVFRSLSSYQPGTFEGWLHRITTNLFLDQARRKQRIRFDALPDDVGDRLPGLLPSPDGGFATRAVRRRHRGGAGASCSPSSGPPSSCATSRASSYEEIADVLDVKIGTVRSRIHRGRSMLRKALAPSRPDRDRDSVSAVPVDPQHASTAHGRMSHLHHKVSALIDGELQGSARRRALAHVRSCADCRREVEQTCALKQRLLGLPPAEPSADLFARPRLASGRRRPRAVDDLAAAAITRSGCSSGPDRCPWPS